MNERNKATVFPCIHSSTATFEVTTRGRKRVPGPRKVSDQNWCFYKMDIVCVFAESVFSHVFFNVQKANEIYF